MNGTLQPVYAEKAEVPILLPSFNETLLPVGFGAGVGGQVSESLWWSDRQRTLLFCRLCRKKNGDLEWKTAASFVGANRETWIVGLESGPHLCWFRYEQDYSVWLCRRPATDSQIAPEVVHLPGLLAFFEPVGVDANFLAWSSGAKWYRVAVNRTELCVETATTNFDWVRIGEFRSAYLLSDGTVVAPTKKKKAWVWFPNGDVEIVSCVLRNSKFEVRRLESVDDETCAQICLAKNTFFSASSLDWMEMDSLPVVPCPFVGRRGKLAYPAMKPGLWGRVKSRSTFAGKDFAIRVRNSQSFWQKITRRDESLLTLAAFEVAINSRKDSKPLDPNLPQELRELVARFSDPRPK